MTKQENVGRGRGNLRPPYLPSWVKRGFLGNMKRYIKTMLGTLNKTFADFSCTLGIAFAPRWLPTVPPFSFSDLASNLRTCNPHLSAQGMLVYMSRFYIL